MLSQVILALVALQVTPSITFRGQIRLNLPAETIRIDLENSKSKEAGAWNAVADKDGNFEFRNLGVGSYRMLVWTDGKKQDRRDFDVVCKPGGTMRKDFFFGKTNPTLTFYFPASDPDVVDVAELQGDYPRDVLKDYERAYEDFVNNNVLRAVQRLEAIVVRAPRFYGAHSRLGMIYQSAGCYADAEAEYEIASKLSPRSAHPLFNLASVQIQSADDPLERAASIERALKTLSRALEINPASALAHCLSGSAQMKVSAYAEAEKSLQRALHYDSRMPAARLMLANLYLKQEQWSEAIGHLNTYLDDHPEAGDRSLVRQLRAEAQSHLP